MEEMTERNQAMRKLSDNGMSYQEIGAQYGISKQRAYQIVGQYKGAKAVCVYCGKDFIQTKKRKGACADPVCRKGVWAGSTPAHLREQKRFDEIASKIAPPDAGGCWLWQGNINSATGYGILTWQGKHIAAHRWMWKQAIGEIPPGLCILHRCDRPACISPKHLFVGTQEDNAKDRNAKGRTASGHHLAPNQIATIRTFYNSMSDCGWLAVAYSVHPTTIYSIATGKTYAQVATQHTQKETPSN